MTTTEQRGQTEWTTDDFIVDMYAHWPLRSRIAIPPDVAEHVFARLRLDAETTMIVRGKGATHQPFFYHAVLRTGCRVEIVQEGDKVARDLGERLRGMFLAHYWMRRPEIEHSLFLLQSTRATDGRRYVFFFFDRDVDVAAGARAIDWLLGTTRRRHFDALVCFQQTPTQRGGLRPDESLALWKTEQLHIYSL